MKTTYVMKIHPYFGFSFITLFLLMSMAALAGPAEACSRVLWNTNGKTVVCARSTDWTIPLDELLLIYPRGLKMDGGLNENSAQWTSKYGSVVSSIYVYASKSGFNVHDGATDGLNEKGLAVHLLYLGETKYEDRNQRPGVSNMRWVRYLLDNFASVSEAVQGMQKIQIVPVPMDNEIAGLHLAMEDQSGDSAIIEYIDANLVIHHGRQVTVMTNDPSYDAQLSNLKNYQDFGGELKLPGTIEADDRFVRATYYLKHLPEPKDEAEAVGYIFSVIRNVAVPFGATYKGLASESTYPTWWISVTDLGNDVYYLNWVNNPNIIRVELKNVDFSEGTPIRILNPRNPALVGEVSRAFEEVK